MSKGVKRFFFVRHGETKNNAEGLYQFYETALSEHGRKQAEFLGKRFGSIPIDTLVSSDMTRALETAEAISRETKHSIIRTPLLREVIRPTLIQGKPQNAPEVVAIFEQVREKFVNGEDWHHSDEESFFDLRARANDALDFLAALPGERIAVVTHGFILRLMVAAMLWGREASPKECARFQHFLTTSNTGITICDYDAGRVDRWLHGPACWKIITWNDHTHLGDVKP